MPANSCTRCGAAIPSNSPAGACPVCLLEFGIGTGPPTSASGTGSLNLPPIERLQRAFPQYEILHLIGHGGMGAVYQAIQRPLDRPVAIKILAPRWAEQPTFAERFLREARTMARLSHPNIVGIFDFGQVDSLYYLVMEYIEGVNLRDAMTVQKMKPSEAFSVIGQICDALQFAHDQGIVHRDVKPENILLTRKGTVKIADFGLAKLIATDHFDVSLTGTHQVLGTVNYMAPEQFEHPETVDHRADLYALGVVFYELLTGELPMGRFAPPSQKAGVSSQLDEVVMRTLEKEPARRFQQASEVKTAVYAATRDPDREDPAPPIRQPLLAPPVPFRINKVYGGFARAYGMIRATESAVELEFEIRDFTDAVKISNKQVSIPYQDLSTAVFRYRALLPCKLRLQADRLKGVADVPTGRGGLFTLTFHQRDAVAASRLATIIQQMITKCRSEYVNVPVPPVKPVSPSRPMDEWFTSVFGDHPRERVRRFLIRWLVILVWVLLVLSAVGGVFTLLSYRSSVMRPPKITRPADRESAGDPAEKTGHPVPASHPSPGQVPEPMGTRSDSSGDG